MASLTNVIINDTGAIQMPVGNTSTRPVLPANGSMRFNSVLSVMEVYNGVRWCYMPDIITNNLKMRLDGAEPSSFNGSGSTWSDISGLNNNGTLTNSPTFLSTYGGGFSFNKSSTYIALPTDLITSNDFTVIMWVKGDGTAGGQTLFGNYPAGPLQLFYGTAFVGMYLDNSSAYGNTSYYSSNPVQFTATRSGTTTSVYINDTLIVTGSSSAGLGTSKPFRIGTNTSGTEAYGGTIYTCQVYDTALSVSQIAQNYKTLRVRFGV